MKTIKVLTILLGVATLFACGGETERVAVPDHEGASKTPASARAERRLFDGAPPTIPHENFGLDCTSCHSDEGMAVEGVGYAPPAPHENTLGLSNRARCEQCHVFQPGDGQFVANQFVGLRQDLREGRRLNPLAPPVIPHKAFMRENCLACHGGPAAREEIRTSHPERARCRQCHVEQVETGVF